MSPAEHIAHHQAWRSRVRPQRGRTQRPAADYPLQAVLFDWSISRYLAPLEQQDDGDWILNIHRDLVPDSDQLLQTHGMKLMGYGIWDIATGLTRLWYIPAVDGNVLDAITALVQMLSDTGDPHRPLAGVPENLLIDQSLLSKSTAARNLLTHLGVATRMYDGGVRYAYENVWSRFERAVLLEDRVTIKLSELHEQVIVWERRHGDRERWREGGKGRIVTRAEAWTALMYRRPADQPLRQIPANLLSYLQREQESASATTDSNKGSTL